MSCLSLFDDKASKAQHLIIKIEFIAIRQEATSGRASEGAFMMPRLVGSHYDIRSQTGLKPTELKPRKDNKQVMAGVQWNGASFLETP
jgi:hypothetical protein